MNADQTFLKLLPQLYAAAADPALWPAFLEDLLGSTQAATGMVLAFDEEQKPVLATQLGVDEAVQRSYREHFFATDIIRERIAAKAPAQGAWVCLREELVDDHELEHNVFYNEYMRPQKMFHQIGTTIGATPGFSVGGLSLLRSEQRGIFDADAVRLLTLIAPHMRNAFLLDRKLRGFELKERMLETVSLAEESAFLAVDADRRVVMGNAAAEQILHRTPRLSMRNGRLRILEKAGDEELQRLIDNASSMIFAQHGKAASTTPMGSMSVPREAGKAPLQISVAPVVAEQRTRFRSEMNRVVMVFLTIPDAEARPRAKAMRQIFLLTPSEARLADLLLAGSTVRETSDVLSVTEESARFMLKSIFRKTGVRNQSGLMRLMLALRC